MAMKDFAHPGVFWLEIPLGLLFVVLLLVQFRALAWLRGHVSARFFRRFTVYGPVTVVLHFLFLFLLGQLLLVAAAGPFRPGEQEQQVSARRTIIALDASFSMVAGDVTRGFGAGVGAKSRFEQAKIFVEQLLPALRHEPVGLLSFSGVTVIHSPPTMDHQALRQLLAGLTLHSSENTGTNFDTVFTEVIHLAMQKPDPCQVLLLSDGEIPYQRDYDSELQLLREAGIPVHAVGFGTRQGAHIVLYDPQDILAGAAEPKVVRKAHTRREHKHLQRITRETGGHYLIVEQGDWVAELLPAFREDSPMVNWKSPGREDLSHIPLALALLGLMVETLGLAAWTARRRRRAGERPFLEMRS
ncbi:MAG: VWA domain-containing protein [Acidobacteria bacterium]|nr:VWA domain-containing protein [Acidobacteriota bacterium]